MKIYVKLEPPYEWVRQVGETVEAFGEVQSLADYPIADDDDVVGVVPGEWVTTHKVMLPTKTRKQFNQALPYALEDAISEDVNNIHFVCHDWRAASEVIVLSVAKEKMQAWQALANNHRLPVTQLLPDHALLPFHDSADCSIANTETGVLARDKETGSVSIEQSLIDVWLMDIPIAATVAVNDEALTEALIQSHPNRDFRHWPFGDKMRHWLEYASSHSLDLWGDQYRPNVSRLGKRAFLAPVVLVAVGITLFMTYDIYRYFSLHTEIQRLDQKMVTILSEVQPGTQGVSGRDARTFMERVLKNGRSQANQWSLHGALASAATVLKRVQATLIELNYQNEEILLSCLLNDFSQVDALTKQLNALKILTASLQGSSAEDGKVIATYSLKQRQG